MGGRGAGWLDQVGIRLTQLSTGLKVEAEVGNIPGFYNIKMRLVSKATLEKSVLIISSNLTLMNLRSAGESLNSSCKTVAAASSPFECNVGFAD